MEELRPNASRAKTAVAYIWIVLGLHAAMLLSDLFQYNLLQTVSSGGSIAPEVAQLNDLLQRSLAMIFLLLYIVSGVMFIMWFRRAYYNLHLKINSLQYSEGWAAGAWFVPFVNLARPYQIMKELFFETDGLLIKNTPGYKSNISWNAIGWWWALWIINNIVSQIEARISRHADTADELLNSTSFSIFDNVLGIVLCIVTVKVIKSYAALEQQLAEMKDDAPALPEEPVKEPVLG